MAQQQLFRLSAASDILVYLLGYHCWDNFNLHGSRQFTKLRHAGPWHKCNFIAPLHYLKSVVSRTGRFYSGHHSWPWVWSGSQSRYRYRYMYMLLHAINAYTHTCCTIHQWCRELGRWSLQDNSQLTGTYHVRVDSTKHMRWFHGQYGHLACSTLIQSSERQKFEHRMTSCKSRSNI